jgi:tetratricopeptide (TPR) repeat protein
MLAELEERYSFVLPGRKLHEIVRDFIREELRLSEPDRAFQIAQKTVDHYKSSWDKANLEFDKRDERIVERKWQQTTLDFLNTFCWCDEHLAINFLAARVIESISFDIGFAKALLNQTKEFNQSQSWWSNHSHHVYRALTQIIDGQDKEELAGLEIVIRESKILDLQANHQIILGIWKGQNFLRTEKSQDALRTFLDVETKFDDHDDITLKVLLADAFDSVGWKLGWERGDSIASPEARTAFEYAVMLNTESGNSQYGLGAIQVKFKNYYYAIAAYQKAIELDPKLATPWNGLGNRYSEQGKTDEGIAAYQKAIELDPKYAAPWNG